MLYRSRATQQRCRLITTTLLACLLLISAFNANVVAHPLGNFTINHYSHLEVGTHQVNIRYVVDMAEIPAFQELQGMIASGSVATRPSQAELDAYVERAAKNYAGGLIVTADGARVPMEVVAKKISLPTGAGGLTTLRIECDLTGILPAATGSNPTERKLDFEDTNQSGRIGWREIVVTPGAGATIFNSSAYGNGVTDELKAYPSDMLSAPLDERTAQLSWTEMGIVPTGAKALRTRDGRAAVQSRDRFAELISVPELTLPIALFGLLIAAGLGALHAFSPGHGKTVVGAYLVGSRGTPRHAAFLGLTVTITHTAGVVALGIVTLFAAQYIVPEKLFPVLSFLSGSIVLVIGLSLFIRRLRSAFNTDSDNADGDQHAHQCALGEQDNSGQEDHLKDDHQNIADVTAPHSHGGRVHRHVPPGAGGAPVTWRSLLALGISGGLLPCPSALVVLLSAISFHRVGFGLLLVVAFSVGLAATLTGIGLAFVYAGRFMKRSTKLSSGRLVRVVPVLSAFVIACVGAAICYEALGQAGVNLFAFIGNYFAQHSAATRSFY